MENYTEPSFPKRDNYTMDIISIVLALIIIGVVVYFAFWMVDASGIPAPFNWLIKGAVLLIGLLWLFQGGSLPHVNL